MGAVVPLHGPTRTQSLLHMAQNRPCLAVSLSNLDRLHPRGLRFGLGMRVREQSPGPSIQETPEIPKARVRLSFNLEFRISALRMGRFGRSTQRRELLFGRM